MPDRSDLLLTDSSFGECAICGSTLSDGEMFRGDLCDLCADSINPAMPHDDDVAADWIGHDVQHHNKLDAKLRERP